MKESEQLLSYLWTCACKDANKSAIWKRSVTLNLGYQNIKKKTTFATFTLPLVLMEH